MRIRRQSSRRIRTAAQNANNIAPPRRTDRDAMSLRDPPPSRKTNIMNRIGTQFVRAISASAGLDRRDETLRDLILLFIEILVQILIFDITARNSCFIACLGADQ
ncbi:MAG: hypothetical protein WA978_05600 [Sphingopyxis granuli]|uniref:hypothetical protein n=1 Tax=Sphingopyxis granuli TaxID=267128 RepID=UPI003C736EA6